jgi:propanol-preferring alcohol dehydrogenase
MRAWILRRQSRIEERPLEFVDDYPTPEPGPHQVRIRIKSTGICRTDLHIAEGELPLHKSPLVPGHQIAGVVDEVGEGVTRFRPGDRAGLTWIYSSCGYCKMCVSGLENHCPAIRRTGWDVDGGYAEYVIAEEGYAIPLDGIPLDFDDLAPMMCPGMTGYLAFELAGVGPGDRLGLLGFGPTAYYVMKVARSMGVDVYVSTRSRAHREIAEGLGARWVGNMLEEGTPVPMDAIISFPAIGEATEKALRSVAPGGVLVLSQIFSTPMTISDYNGNLWGRTIRTVQNVRRSSIYRMVEAAKRIDMGIPKDVFGFDELQEAAIRSRKGELEGLTAVVRVQ